MVRSIAVVVASIRKGQPRKRCRRRPRRVRSSCARVRRIGSRRPPSRSRATGPSSATVPAGTPPERAPWPSLRARHQHPTPAGPGAVCPTSGPGPAADSALRGYERRQVDEYVARQRTTATPRAQLAEAERQRRPATEHAEATEENRRLRSTAGREASGRGGPASGPRSPAPAEQEAAEVRARTPVRSPSDAGADPCRGREASARGRAATDPAPRS